MQQQFRERIYSRIETLAQGKEERLMDYLAKATTAAERQAKLRAQRESDGFKRVPIWIHESILHKLRERYPGPRGGVDWIAVIDKALEVKNA